MSEVSIANLRLYYHRLIPLGTKSSHKNYSGVLQTVTAKVNYGVPISPSNKRICTMDLSFNCRLPSKGHIYIAKAILQRVAVKGSLNIKHSQTQTLGILKLKIQGYT